MLSPILRNIAIITAGITFCAGGLNAQSLYFKVGGEPWQLNDPFDKETKPDPANATVSGQNITIKKKIAGSTVEITRKFTDIARIDWGKTPPALEEADLEVLRGDGSKALTLIEPIVRFFTPLKKTPGNLWLRAASIKLDALVLLKNDAVIGEFIGELEEMNDGSIIGLDEKIKLAKLDQLARKGKSEQALAEADKLMRDTSNLDLIAQLTIIKGNALLQLRRYEESMNMFLRIPVFYGSQAKYVPPALLGAAKSFRGMDTPQNKHLGLEAVANKYFTEIVTQYPLSKEAEEAVAMLPKALRESLTEKKIDSDLAGTPAAEPAKTEKPPEEKSGDNE